MRKQIDNLLTEDITKLKRCHIYNGNTLSDVKLSRHRRNEKKA